MFALHVYCSMYIQNLCHRFAFRTKFWYEWKVWKTFPVNEILDNNKNLDVIFDRVESSSKKNHILFDLLFHTYLARSTYEFWINSLFSTHISLVKGIRSYSLWRCLRYQEKWWSIICEIPSIDIQIEDNIVWTFRSKDNCYEYG